MADEVRTVLLIFLPLTAVLALIALIRRATLIVRGWDALADGRMRLPSAWTERGDRETRGAPRVRPRSRGRTGATTHPEPSRQSGEREEGEHEEERYRIALEQHRRRRPDEVAEQHVPGIEDQRSGDRGDAEARERKTSKARGGDYRRAGARHVKADEHRARPTRREARDRAVEPFRADSHYPCEAIHDCAPRRAREEELDRPADRDGHRKRDEELERRVRARGDLHTGADHDQIGRDRDGNTDLLEEHDREDREHAVARV